MTNSNSASPPPVKSNSATFPKSKSNSALLSIWVYGIAILLQYNQILDSCINMSFGETPPILNSAFLYLAAVVVCFVSYMMTSTWQDLWLSRIFLMLAVLAVTTGMTTYISNIVASALLIAFFVAAGRRDYRAFRSQTE